MMLLNKGKLAFYVCNFGARCTNTKIPFVSGRQLSSAMNIFNNAQNKEQPEFRDPVRQVLISQSQDKLKNLALEDWIYRNHDFKHKHLLLLWQSSSKFDKFCGNSTLNQKKSRDLESYANRNNEKRVTIDISCTFITRLNSSDIFRNFNIVFAAIERISGTNRPLCREVLASSIDCMLHESDKSSNVEFSSSQTIRVPVSKLCEVDPSLTSCKLFEALGWEFLRTSADGSDRGMKVANCQRGFQLVRPDEDWFPGFDNLYHDLKTHLWLLEKNQNVKNLPS